MDTNTKKDLISFAAGSGVATLTAAFTGAAALAIGFYSGTVIGGVAGLATVAVIGALTVATADNSNIELRFIPMLAGAATSVTMMFGAAVYNQSSQVEDLTENHNSAPAAETMRADIDLNIVDSAKSADATYLPAFT